MDHLGISITIDSRAAVCVAGVTTPGASYFSGVWFLANEKATESTGYNNFRTFCSSLGVSCNVKLSLQIVRTSFTANEITACFLLYNLLYLFSQFEVFMEHLKLRKPKMAFLLSMESTGFLQVLI